MSNSYQLLDSLAVVVLFVVQNVALAEVRFLFWACTRLGWNQLDCG